MIEKILAAIENITGPLSDHQRADIRQEIEKYGTACVMDSSVRGELFGTPEFPPPYEVVKGGIAE